MTRTLLLDADLLAYRASSANQRSYDWNGDGNKSVAADEEAARKVVEETIEKFAERLDADEVIVCLSDDFSSFRKDRVKSDYKAVRNEVERPLHLYDIKDWMAETYTTERWTSLEADDVMGILMTDPDATDMRVMVSADKDMMTIPGFLYRPQEDLWHPNGPRKGKPPIHHITLEQADRFHLWQTIVGDQTDGYTGLPGAGPAAAEELLMGLGWEGYQHTLKSGPRKGQEETRWRRIELPVWKAIVSAYEKAGLTEADAITQARLARILRHGEWDGRSPLLWSPPQG